MSLKFPSGTVFGKKTGSYTPSETKNKNAANNSESFVKLGNMLDKMDLKNEFIIKKKNWM